jgi:hypothetical protein
MKPFFVLFALLIVCQVADAQSVLLEPTAGNGIFSKNPTIVISEPPAGSVTLPASGAGTRLMWIPAKSAFRVGTASGTDWDIDNIGLWSFAAGRDTKATGNFAAAIGFATDATGNSSIATGFGTSATGFISTAMGANAQATGYYSVAMGEKVTAQAMNSVAMGRYNVIAGNRFEWINTNPLLVVGNGSDDSTPNNALTLLKNANLGINVANPLTRFHVNNGNSGHTPSTGTFGPTVFVERDNHTYLELASPDNKERGVIFSNPTDDNSGGIYLR